MQLQNKNILVGVSGGIAAYKTCTLIRLLIKEGANVKVVMTKAATKFVNPNTFKALTKHDVAIDIFSESEQIDHINLTKNIDLFVIAPATANTIAKMACGIADNMLTTTALACGSKILIAPAMNTFMYQNPVTQENLQKLVNRGLLVVKPGNGDLACGDTGPGRMAEPEELAKIIIALLTNNVLEYKKDNLYLEQLENQLDFKQTLLLSASKAKDLKILITAGPTREYIDPVRYISNESSGKMGYALADLAHKKGASVTLISGPVAIEPPKGVTVKHVVTADQMYDSTMSEIYNQHYDIVIATAAIADFKPLEQSPVKIKKNPDINSLQLLLVKNKDLLASIAKLDNKPYCVGFAAETNNLTENAQAKLNNKGLDLIVLNDVSRKDIGFNSDDNQVCVFSKQGKIQEYNKMPKKVLASLLIDLIVDLYKKQADK